MSHFTVLVIGPDHEQALAPFHEYECTGRDDEYVVDVDMTEEARAKYEKDTERMVEKNGERVSAYDDQFYRDPTEAEIKKHGPFFGSGGGRGISYTSQDWGDGKGHRAKVLDVPDGWTEITVPISETKTFADWCEYYYGWTAVKHGEEPNEEQKYGRVELGPDGKVAKCLDRTNPNAKWDWFAVGGRWRGFFPLKAGVDYDGALLGEPGTGEHLDIRDGKGPRANYEAERRIDQVRLGDVDFEHARDKEERVGRHGFAKWKAIFEKHGKPTLSWEQVNANIDAEIEELNAKGIREEKVPHPNPEEDFELNREGLARHTWHQRYHEQPAIAAFKELRMWVSPVEEFGYDEEAYAQRCRQGALVPFAIVKDGKWFAKGEMGWWAVVHDEKEEDKWREEVARLYDDLPPDTQLTLVDCHI